MSTDTIPPRPPSASHRFAFGLLIAFGLAVGAVVGVVIGLFTGLIPVFC